MPNGYLFPIPNIAKNISAKNKFDKLSPNFLCCANSKILFEPNSIMQEKYQMLSQLFISILVYVFITNLTLDIQLN